MYILLFFNNFVGVKNQHQTAGEICIARAIRMCSGTPSAYTYGPTMYPLKSDLRWIEQYVTSSLPVVTLKVPTHHEHRSAIATWPHSFEWIVFGGGTASFCHGICTAPTGCTPLFRQLEGGKTALASTTTWPHIWTSPWRQRWTCKYRIQEPVSPIQEPAEFVGAPRTTRTSP